MVRDYNFLFRALEHHPKSTFFFRVLHQAAATMRLLFKSARQAQLTARNDRNTNNYFNCYLISKEQDSQAKELMEAYELQLSQEATRNQQCISCIKAMQPVEGYLQPLDLR